MDNPRIHSGDKAAISTKTPEEFPLIISVFIGTGEHLWCSFHSTFAMPPDKSGGFRQVGMFHMHRKSLQDFYYQIYLCA